MVLFLAFLVLLCGCDYQYSKVPSDANPADFKKLVAWKSCGASGQHYSQVIIFGNEIAFEDAIDDLEQRHRRKEWTVRPFDENSSWSAPGIAMSNLAKDECVSLHRFDATKYAPGGGGGPTVERMAELVAPYSTLIVAGAGCG